MRALLLFLTVVGGGCVKSDAVVCSDGVVCPADTLCDTANGGCIVEAQLGACAGLPAAADCTLPDDAPGLCTNGVCLGHVCGDSRQSGPEQCDPTSSVMAETSSNCLDLGFYNDAPVTCAADCTWNRNPCGARCGDGVLDAELERCETNIPIQGSCLEYAFDRGVLGCGACVASFVDCADIGWKTRGVPGAPTRGSVAGSAFAVAIRGATDSIAALFDGVAFQPLGSFEFTGGQPIGLDLGLTSASDIWVGGDLQTSVLAVDGFVAHYDGTTWSLVRTFDAPITRMFVAGTHVWAIEGAVVHHYDGTTWTEQTLATSEVLAVAGTGPDDVWIAGGGLWHGGATQAFTAVTGPGGTPEGVAVLPGGVVMTTTLDSGTNRMRLHIRTNNVWSTSTYPPANFFNHGEIFALAADDVYVTFDDGNGGLGLTQVAHFDGARWHQLSSSAVNQTSNYIHALSVGGSAQHGVFAFDPFFSRAYRYAGSAWVTNAVANYVSRMVAVTPTEIYGTDATGNVLRFDGVVWATAPQTAKGVVDSASPEATYSLEVGAPPHLWHRTGPGTWASATLPQANYEMPGVLGENDVFLTQENASVRNVRHWNGSTIVATNAPTTISPAEAFRAIDCRPTFGCTIVGPMGVWHTPGAPDAWAQVTTVPAGLDPTSVWIAPDGTTFIGDAGGTIMWAGAGSATWNATQFSTFGPVMFISGTTASDVFAAVRASGGFESLHHFDGTRWGDVRVPYAALDNEATALLAFDGGLLLGARFQSITFHLARTSAW